MPAFYSPSTPLAIFYRPTRWSHDWTRNGGRGTWWARTQEEEIRQGGVARKETRFTVFTRLAILGMLLQPVVFPLRLLSFINLHVKHSQLPCFAFIILLFFHQIFSFHSIVSILIMDLPHYCYSLQKSVPIFSGVS